MKRKKAYVIAAVGAVICVAAGTGFYCYNQRGSEAALPAMPEAVSLSENVISATGLTSVGMLEETYELGFLEEGLYVEETYLNMGDEVEAGTAVFKVSEESLESARRELEKQVQETALNRRQGAITYETGLVDAQKEKDLAAVEAEYAQSVYDNAVAAAQDELDALQEKVNEAQDKVDEYTASIEEDYYYAYYEVAEKEATWKDNAAFLMELYREWNVEALEDIYGGSGGKNGIGYVTNQVTASSAGSASQTGGSQSAGTASSASAQSGSAGGVSFSKESVTGAYFTEESQTQLLGEAQSSDNSADGSGMTAGTESSVESEMSEDTKDEESGSSAVEESGSSAAGGTEEEEPTQDAGAEDGEDGGTENDAADDAGEEGGNPSGFGGNPGGGFGSNSGGFGGGSSVSGNDIGKGSSVNVGDDEIRYNIYLAMEEEAEESQEAYETALENYENAKKKAEAGIAEARSELVVLKAQLEEQQTAYEKAVIAAKLDYDLAVSGNENAQMVYESSVKQLEEEYEALKEEEETAAENLALFEETMGDGVFYTGSAGTVMMTMVRASQWITEDTVVIAYSNPDTVTISAYVDQADIASVKIGEEAFVLIGGYGSYAGRVTSVNPVSSSNGSSVTYTVNVLLEGDVSDLEANLTAYVYLGLTQEEQDMMSGSTGSGEDGEKARPEGMSGEEMPEGMSDQELPEGMSGQEMREGSGGRMQDGGMQGGGNGFESGGGFGPGGGGQ